MNLLWVLASVTEYSEYGRGGTNYFGDGDHYGMGDGRITGDGFPYHLGFYSPQYWLRVFYGLGDEIYWGIV